MENKLSIDCMPVNIKNLQQKNLETRSDQHPEKKTGEPIEQEGNSIVNKQNQYTNDEGQDWNIDYADVNTKIDYENHLQGNQGIITQFKKEMMMMLQAKPK